ncbi:ABC-type lipoprotein export system ATPase subunit [Mycetocola sp. BIGb0189]|uniref:ABC transporter ATP-binding protein n=1 Tax=Mycetocola sp. BIGb0189 TaxID=2940604 RepID=UPI0021694EB3|nr:ATP-binding cassette domain-containing protein [Mycetocola sp. BIGb0189]MCS4274878.1 ABC-type lipoprotein export system ATPase subunit [Mycetocola sp. BIGb0189]
MSEQGTPTARAHSDGLTAHRVTLVRTRPDGTPVPVLDGLDLEVSPGEMVCVSGRSGTGKSTLLEVCAGGVRPTSGELFWASTRLHTLPDRPLERWRSATVGYLDQGSSLLEELRIVENVLLGIARPSTADIHAAHAVLTRLGIGHLADSWPRECSGGERQRAAIARALLRAVPLLIFDEPTASLDARSATLVLDALDEARTEGAAILVASHDDLVLNRADRIIRL